MHEITTGQQFVSAGCWKAYLSHGLIMIHMGFQVSLEEMKMHKDSMQTHLDRMKFHYKKSANRERLNVLLKRAESGLVSYDGCTVAELRKFCRDRKLVIEGTGQAKVSKLDLVEFLESEDERPRFHGFLELPAELRNSIYHMHFEQIALASNPIPPPVTEVCSQLRNESSLLFYKTWPLEIDLELPLIKGRQPHRTADLARVRFSPTTVRFFKRIPKIHLQHIRKLRVYGPLFLLGWRVRTAWDVDFGLDGKNVQISYMPVNRGHMRTDEESK
ncbi:hypothetical protein LTR37_015125 [Vermiconidia calcicola]|uniref:Uncharacterized protein n=1 Tax=Vermiconidia calcicola TaxID=1690605 RepID=A0ACC3MRS7_9PEZI|nr:hypothetical protein LTR37_015125 [Vermiconidia calcicola]